MLNNQITDIISKDEIYSQTMLYYFHSPYNSMYSLNEKNQLVYVSLSSETNGVTPMTNDEDWTVVDFPNLDDNTVHTLKTIENLLTVSQQMQKQLFQTSPRKGLSDFYERQGG